MQDIFVKQCFWFLTECKVICVPVKILLMIKSTQCSIGTTRLLQPHLKFLYSKQTMNQRYLEVSYGSGNI